MLPSATDDQLDLMLRHYPDDPRQGCPFVDSETPTETSATLSPGPELSQALGTMLNIDEPRDAWATATPGPSRLPTRPVGRSLASLSTNSSAIVSRLLQPGIMDDLTDTEDPVGEDGLQKWREHVASPTKAQRRKAAQRLMPGTLKTPTPSMIPTDSSPSPTDPCFPAGATKPDVVEHDALPVPSAVPSESGSRTLIRSMSIDERNAFLDGLADISKAPPVMVYQVPMADVAAIARSAAKLGFHTRVVEPRGLDEVDGLMIIAKDDAVVEKLFATLGQDVKQQGGGIRAINAVAGGAVVGAVATFTGLAFS